MAKSEANCMSAWLWSPCSGLFCHPNSSNQVLEKYPSKSLSKTCLPTTVPQKSGDGLGRTSGSYSLSKERQRHGAGQPPPGSGQVGSQAGLHCLTISTRPQHPCGTQHHRHFCWNNRLPSSLSTGCSGDCLPAKPSHLQGQVTQRKP